MEGEANIVLLQLVLISMMEPESNPAVLLFKEGTAILLAIDKGKGADTCLAGTFAPLVWEGKPTFAIFKMN